MCKSNLNHFSHRMWYWVSLLLNRLAIENDIVLSFSSHHRLDRCQMQFVWPVLWASVLSLAEVELLSAQSTLSLRSCLSFQMALVGESTDMIMLLLQPTWTCTAGSCLSSFIHPQRQVTFHLKRMWRLLFWAL